MKTILMSIRPQWVAKILNGEKTIEIRKKFPKDYAGWVYIYCTKDHKNGLHWNTKKWVCVNNNTDVLKEICFNGKVVARFWCDKVEQVFWHNPRKDEHIPYLKSCNLLKCACLCQDEFEEYVGDNESYAIHITKLEIFDKPKKISEFFTAMGIRKPSYMLQKAPQSWCYIEV